MAGYLPLRREFGEWREMPPRRRFFERLAATLGRTPRMVGAQRILAVGSFVAHLVFGLAILFRYGPPGSSPAWGVLAEVWSDYGSPLAFLGIAALAFAGLFSVQWLRFSLYLGSLVMVLWALALGIAWYVGYGPQPSLFWIGWIGLLKWCAATYGLKYDRQTAQIDRLSSQVADTVHRSQLERGRDAGDVGAP